MPQLILRQLEYESDTWKRILGFMIDENIYLKSRLVEILNYISDKNFLEGMEDFQNRFIIEDEMISLLRNDVVELDQLLVREIFENGKIKKEINRKLNKLRNNIVNVETQFSKLKLEFNNYLSEMLNDGNRQVYLSNN